MGAAVGALARSFGTAACPPGAAVPPGSVTDCASLVASLAARVGAVAGAAVIVMALLAVGLHRTAVRLEEARREVAARGAGPSG
ncbi:MAG TPA: hypothetical protein VNO79_05035 [Actinomycetota bacterium]|nr:hypothetical protein [Actinomycetota bacterium]